MVARSERVREGTRHELHVALRLTELGGVVAWPMGDGAPWDLAVDFGGKFSRLQVKGTDTEKNRGYRVSLAAGNNHHRLYTAAETEFIVAVTPIGDYVIPVDKIDRDRLITWTGGRRKGNLPYYDRFKEAWNLLQ